ncbi:hypothetical protein [Longitalea luteola]|uniref:hypothetical protein n=1 Tax=Longitalea luteola TaxID=2812563 RepID=UPI001A972E2D|nr:hypothetical protein [Longitalea luteola]
MRIKIFLLVVLSGYGLISTAQEAKQEQPATKGCSCSFSSINQGGVLHGSRGQYFQFQTINGVKYKAWFAGIGLGLDHYYRLGFPVFLDVRKYLFDKPTTPFLYVDGGVHLIAQKKEQVSQWHYNRYKSGWYADAGIGMKFGFQGKGRWLISTGYSYKNITRDFKSSVDCPTNRCYETFETYRNYLHRLSLKLGLQF